MYMCAIRAMLDQREPPRCRGLELEVSAPRDRLEALKNRARTSHYHSHDCVITPHSRCPTCLYIYSYLVYQIAAPRTDEFTYLGLGLTVYSRAWMYEGKHLPLVKGLGVIAIEKDGTDLMKAIQERKRVMRELERERRRRNGGDLDDGFDDQDVIDDDDDFDLVEELFGDNETSGDDASALAEKNPLGSVGKPRLPLLPVFTLGTLGFILGRLLCGS